jgi:hypothetical protein
MRSRGAPQRGQVIRQPPSVVVFRQAAPRPVRGFAFVLGLAAWLDPCTRSRVATSASLIIHQRQMGDDSRATFLAPVTLADGQGAAGARAGGRTTGMSTLYGRPRGRLAGASLLRRGRTARAFRASPKGIPAALSPN